VSVDDLYLYIFCCVTGATLPAISQAGIRNGRGMIKEGDFVRSSGLILTGPILANIVTDSGLPQRVWAWRCHADRTVRTAYRARRIVRAQDVVAVEHAHAAGRELADQRNMNNFVGQQSGACW